MPTRKYHFQEITIDVATELPESEDFNAILVVADWFAKGEYYMEAKTTCIADNIADSYINDI